MEKIKIVHMNLIANSQSAIQRIKFAERRAQCAVKVAIPWGMAFVLFSKRKNMQLVYWM